MVSKDAFGDLLAVVWRENGRGADERGPPASEDGDLPGPTPAREDDGSFYCPRCEETVHPEEV